MDVFKGITTVVSVPINSEMVLVLVVPEVTTVQVHTRSLLQDIKAKTKRQRIRVVVFMGLDLKFKGDLSVSIKKIPGTVFIQFFHSPAVQFHW